MKKGLQRPCQLPFQGPKGHNLANSAQELPKISSAITNMPKFAPPPIARSGKSMQGPCPPATACHGIFDTVTGHTCCMTSSKKIDLAVVGGGMTGLAFATAVAGAGAEVALIDPVPWPDTVAPPFDGRVTAVARASRHLLEGIGVWPTLLAEAEPIVDIEVSEHASPFRVFYDHREAGREPLGHIVENRTIRVGLIERAKALTSEGLTLCIPDKVRHFQSRRIGPWLRWRAAIASRRAWWSAPMAGARFAGGKRAST